MYLTFMVSRVCQYFGYQESLLPACWYLKAKCSLVIRIELYLLLIPYCQGFGGFDGDVLMLS